MKNRILILTMLIFSLLIVSCSNDDSNSEYANTIETRFVASLIEGQTDLPIPFEGTTIELTNKLNGNKNTITLDNQGVAIVKLRQGSYSAIARQTLTKEIYNKLIDDTKSLEEKTQDDNITLTANIDEIKIDAAGEVKIAMKMNKTVVGGFVLKQIYYAGSSLTDGAAYRDQFIEIYNNSSETLYADGLMLALLHNSSYRSYNEDGPHLLPSKQYDWSKSEGNTGDGNLNNDYVYASNLFRIPGNGTQYPVEAGKSIIIAGTAIDHTKTYITTDATKLVDPNKTIDLSNAEFDVYVLDYLKKEFDIDVTNAKYRYNLYTVGIGKLEVLNLQSGDLGLRFATDDGIILVDLPKDVNVLSFPKVKAPKSNDSNMCVRIPNKFIVDGVQIRNAKDNRVAPRKVPESVDSGNTFVPNGTYSSQALLRKTKYKLSNGRRVLQDTNNSTEDFVVIDKPVSSKGEDSFTN